MRYFHEDFHARPDDRPGLPHWHLRAGAVGIARTRRPPEGRQGLLPGQQIAAVVGHRRVADRRQHLRRTDHRHVRFGLCHRPSDRLVRMDGRADPADRRQVVPAGVPAQRHPHHAAVPGKPVRPAHPHGHGGVLAGALRVRQPHLDHVAGVDRGGAGDRAGPDDRAGAAGGLRTGLPAVRRPEGGGADRPRAGDAAGAGWAGHHLHHAGAYRRSCTPSRATSR
ncbi:MAG: hypothetical protein GAK43_00164 [Stenotrophomonas maltophilia]|nr:MAG: hypothetical protein GAK43_00164 [Stenotrophomonas maltophilia]